MRDKAGLPTVERMLTAAAKRRTERSRARRRGTGFAVIVFAGLALVGSAAAAVGLWDPVPFGGGQPEVSKPAAEDGAGAATASVPPGSVLTPDVSPSQSEKKQRGRTQGASGRTAVASTDLPAAIPLPPPPGQGVPSGAEAPNREPRGGGAAQDASDGGASPTPPGSGGGGNGGQPNVPGPDEEKGGPGPAQISVVCSAESVTVGQAVSCKATVRGSGPAPTGGVLFKSTGAGAFTTNPCTLGGGGGGVSSCAVTYTPEGAGTHQLSAFYEGDGANASDSTSFVIKANP